MARKSLGARRPAEADHGVGGPELFRQPHGGALRPPYQLGTSGNPGGYSRARHVTNAYNRLLQTDVEEFDRFEPKTPAERIAMTMIRAASTLKNLRVDAAKEIVDRTEGRAAASNEDRGVLEDTNATARAALILKYMKDLGLLKKGK